MKEYSLALVGFGNVGRAFARLLQRKADVMREQFDATFKVTGITTGRHGAAIDTAGLDLERALQNRPAEDAWANGIDLIKHKLQAILEAEGIQRIEAEGAIFDPNFHEAISYEPADGVESGRVIAVVQNGYMMGERVLRPAMVRVAK